MSDERKRDLAPPRSAETLAGLRPEGESARTPEEELWQEIEALLARTGMADPRLVELFSQCLAEWRERRGLSHRARLSEQIAERIAALPKAQRSPGRGVTSAVWDGVSRVVGTDLARRLQRRLDRTLLRDAQPEPEVQDGQIVWRSRFGPRKHELVVPPWDSGRRAWQRIRPLAAFLPRQRPVVFALGAPSLVGVLGLEQETQVIEGESADEVISKECPDLLVIDSAFLTQLEREGSGWLESIAERSLEVGSQVVVWVAAEGSDFDPASVAEGVAVVTELPRTAKALLKRRPDLRVFSIGPVAFTRALELPLVERGGLGGLAVSFAAPGGPELPAGFRFFSGSQLASDFKLEELVEPARDLEPADYLEPAVRISWLGETRLSDAELARFGRALSLGFAPVLSGALRSDRGDSDVLDLGLPVPHLTAPPGKQEDERSQAHRVSHLATRFARERLSQRAAMARFSAHVGVPPICRAAKMVSVICVSNRPERLGACVEAYRRQSYQHKELILVANVDSIDDAIVDSHGICAADVTLLRTDDAVSLGESLNRARSVARGELWTKFDDDDYYGPHYLRDAVLALEHSAAAVVGKGTFYTFIEGIDRLYLTPEAPENALSERYVHGGTILAERRSVEGIDFPPVKRGTDTLFLQLCKLEGLRIYSADRYNFAYIRYGQPGHHTFDISHQSFLKHSRFLGNGFAREQIDI